MNIGNFTNVIYERMQRVDGNFLYILFFVHISINVVFVETPEEIKDVIEMRY